MCSTCLLVFAVGSWVTWFSRRERMNRWANSQNDNLGPFWVKIIAILWIFSASSSFFLSMKKITWLNSQQPKTRGHVDCRASTLVVLQKQFALSRNYHTLVCVYCEKIFKSQEVLKEHMRLIFVQKISSNLQWAKVVLEWAHQTVSWILKLRIYDFFS